MNAAAAATAGSHRSSQVDEAYRSRRASDDPNADRLSRALRRGSSVEAPLSPGLRLRTSQGDAYAGVVPGLNIGASRVASAPAAADFRPSLAFAGSAVRTSFAGGALLHDDARHATTREPEAVSWRDVAESQGASEAELFKSGRPEKTADIAQRCPRLTAWAAKNSFLAFSLVHLVVLTALAAAGGAVLGYMADLIIGRAEIGLLTTSMTFGVAMIIATPLLSTVAILKRMQAPGRAVALIEFLIFALFTTLVAVAAHQTFNPSNRWMLVSRLNSMVFDEARAAVSPAPPAQRPPPGRAHRPPLTRRRRRRRRRSSSSRASTRATSRWWRRWASCTSGCRGR